MPNKADSTAIAICRVSLAFIWIYQGLIPKLLGPHADELAMDLALGISAHAAKGVAQIAGVSEIAIGVAVLFLRRQKWPLWLTLFSMVALLGYASFTVPRLLLGAFNPVTINVAMAALALIAILLEKKRTEEGPHSSV